MEECLRALDDYHRTIDHRALPARLLAGGRWFQGRADSDEYDAAKRWRTKHRPKAGQCYYNAQAFCLRHEEASYFEGFAVFTGLGQPAEHAWAAMPDGNVVDFTFEAAERIAMKKQLPCDTRDTLYVGLEIPTEFLVEAVLRREWFESIADEYLLAENQVIR